MLEEQSKALENETHSEFVTRSLGEFIRHNKQLEHLDLSNTGLSEQVFIGLVPYLKRAKSILGLHLSHNPGVSAEVKAFLHKKMRLNTEENRLKLPINSAFDFVGNDAENHKRQIDRENFELDQNKSKKPLLSYKEIPSN